MPETSDGVCIIMIEREAYLRCGETDAEQVGLVLSLWTRCGMGNATHEKCNKWGQVSDSLEADDGYCGGTPVRILRACVS